MARPMPVNSALPAMTALLLGVIAVLIWRSEPRTTQASALFSALLAWCAVEALPVVYMGLRQPQGGTRNERGYRLTLFGLGSAV